MRVSSHEMPQGVFQALLYICSQFKKGCPLQTLNSNAPIICFHHPWEGGHPWGIWQHIRSRATGVWQKNATRESGNWQTREERRNRKSKYIKQHIKFLKKFIKKLKICRYGEPFCGRCFSFLFKQVLLPVVFPQWSCIERRNRARHR
jgi:hypothetical protein